VYSRDYQNKKLTFEASGGLINSSLVMQDRETDTFWSIMTGEAIGGELKGTKLVELPVGERRQWKEWFKKHPDTLVLSVNGNEDRPPAYESYFNSMGGFRGARAQDTRLNTKAPVFAFRLKGQTYAVEHKKIENGKTFDIDNIKLFLFRPAGSSIFQSTTAYQITVGNFIKIKDQWVHTDSGCIFDSGKETFPERDLPCPPRFEGFDTFWYNWSLSNPATKILAN